MISVTHNLFLQNENVLKEIEDQKVQESKLADELLDGFISADSTMNECFNTLQQLQISI